jgi:hypothetical protein
MAAAFTAVAALDSSAARKEDPGPASSSLQVFKEGLARLNTGRG